MVDSPIHNLGILKYEPEERIESALDVCADSLSWSASKEKAVLSLLRKQLVTCDLAGKNLLMAVLLSFLLGDIGGQMDPYLRACNIEKLRSICNRREIDYQLVAKMTAYEQQMRAALASEESTAS